MKRFIVNLPWSILCLIITLSVNSQATDFTILKPGHQLKDFDSLVSPNGIYALSFFYPNSSQTSSIRYLGIVFMRNFNPRYVWIANRENPLTNSSGILNLTEEGNLILTFGTEWNITINTVKPDSDNVSVNLTLSNSGNLVLRAGQQIVWQSFEQPTDTLLPGLQIGIFGLKTKNPEKRFLTSWLSSDQVAFPGAFTLGVDPDDRTRLVIWKRDEIYWHSGIWVRKSFGNFPSYLQFNYTSNENDNYFTFLGIKSDFVNLASSCVQLISSGELYVNEAIGISSIATPNTLSLCNDYGGCVPGKKPLCKSGEEFSSRKIEYSFIEWRSAYNYSIDLSYCQEMCEKNCHCLAYKTPQDGSGCEFFENKTSLILQRLHDARENGTQVYVRNSILKGGISKKMGLGLGIGGFGAFLIVCACCYVVWKKYFAKSDKDEANKVLMYELGIAPLDEDRTTHKSRLSTKRNHELPYFSFSSIRVATKNFDPENFLGQGGFGQVYKGTLEGGIEIAVKRLSQTSSQGVKEFENEVIMMSKLQHRNLVRLLGCCIHGEERMLIYEYLPNKSLDAFLFDSTKRRNIDWKMRLSIIEGIAQGLLYLHKYSRSKIIHRDLKASNVLLDSNMNPKISDFGTARIFTENELDANTKSIVGTHGYMSPEFAMNGLFSEKSDVFSYGVMLLEIISGKQNIVFYHSDCSTTLLGIAWELWKEGQGLKLVEPELKGTYPSKEEVLRCIQIALLCVQESAADRPTISDVVSMLRNESTTLPTPEQPAFCNVPSMQDINKQEDEDSKTSTKSCESEIQIVNR